MFDFGPSLRWQPVAAPAPVTLRGRTVTLEPLSAVRHAADLWQVLAGHDDLWTWMGDGPFADEAALRQAVAVKESAPGMFFFALEPAATGRAEGWACLMRAEPAHGAVEVGNIVLAPSLQRTTAATEAMFLLAAHVFDTLGYRRYEWKCNAENLASRRAAERLGFTFEGIFRQHMVVKGRNRDTAWFSMLDREWPARKRALEAWLDPGNFDADGFQMRSLGQIAALQG
jgi:RimJ/RimL family protein N-acetyltransferase